MAGTAQRYVVLHRPRSANPWHLHLYSPRQGKSWFVSSHNTKELAAAARDAATAEHAARFASRSN